MGNMASMGCHHDAVCSGMAPMGKHGIYGCHHGRHLFEVMASMENLASMGAARGSGPRHNAVKPVKPKTLAAPAAHRGSQPEVKFSDQFVVVVELVSRTAFERDLTVRDDVAAVGDAQGLGKFCSAMRTVSLYWSLSSLILSMVRLTSTGASPTEGSSIKRIRGASISARASANICCSPPLMLPASCARRSASRGKHSKQKVRFSLMCARAFLRNAPSRRFSCTVSRGNSRRLPVPAIPRSTIFGGAADQVVALAVDLDLDLPAVGRTIPMMLFISVDSVAVGTEQHHRLPPPTVSDTSSSTRTCHRRR